VGHFGRVNLERRCSRIVIFSARTRDPAQKQTEMRSWAAPESEDKMRLGRAPAMPRDVVRTILAPYLCWAEQYALRLSCVAFNRWLVDLPSFNFARIFSDQVIASGDAGVRAGDAFLDALRRSGNQVTGSFLLQAMFGGVACPWASSVNNIDVLVLVPENLSPRHDSDANCSPAGYDNICIPGRLPDSLGLLQSLFSWRRPYDDDDCYSPSLVLAHRLCFYHIGGESGRSGSEEILGSEYLDETYGYRSPEAFVREEADFAFTKVLFDGRRLSVYDWNSVWTRQCTVRARSFRLLPFYSSTSFRGSHVGDADVADVVGRLCRRCSAYAARGFTVRTNVPRSPEARHLLNAELVYGRELALTEMRDWRRSCALGLGIRANSSEELICPMDRRERACRRRDRARASQERRKLRSEFGRRRRARGES